MNAAYSCERGWRITQLHPFFLAQKDYLCCLVGVLDVANFSELRIGEVRILGILGSSHSPGCRQGVFPETRLAPALSPKHARVRTVPGVPYNIWHTHSLLGWWHTPIGPGEAGFPTTGPPGSWVNRGNTKSPKCRRVAFSGSQARVCGLHPLEGSP